MVCARRLENRQLDRDLRRPPGEAREAKSQPFSWRMGRTSGWEELRDCLVLFPLLSSGSKVAQKRKVALRHGRINLISSGLRDQRM